MNPYAVHNINKLRSSSNLSNRRVHSIHLACTHQKWFISNLITRVEKQPVTSALSKIEIVNDNCRASHVTSF